MSKFNHPYHIVTIRPWPLVISFSLIILLVGFLKYFYRLNQNIIYIGLLILIFRIYQWWRDIIRERCFQGWHTFKLVKILKIGIILFILSEVIFFLRFFWTYFHLFLSPRTELGRIWPPINLEVFDPYNIPLFNTIILLSSGVTITARHHYLLNRNFYKVKFFLLLTILLGLFFRYIQYLEYKNSFFRIIDRSYGSIFFIITGFHGIHVIIGTVFIFISYYRLLINQFSIIHHIGFEFRVWYWHFVDIVWLFLYIFIYWLSYYLYSII